MQILMGDLEKLTLTASQNYLGYISINSSRTQTMVWSHYTNSKRSSLAAHQGKNWVEYSAIDFQMHARCAALFWRELLLLRSNPKHLFHMPSVPMHHAFGMSSSLEGLLIVCKTRDTAENISKGVYLTINICPLTILYKALSNI